MRTRLEQIARLCDQVSGRLWFVQLLTGKVDFACRREDAGVNFTCAEPERQFIAEGRGEGRAFCAPLRRIYL